MPAIPPPTTKALDFGIRVFQSAGRQMKCQGA
jgi:hypothetical protein